MENKMCVIFTLLKISQSLLFKLSYKSELGTQFFIKHISTDITLKQN